MTVEELINNAPSDWTFGCMSKRLISEAIGSKEHVKGIIDCLHPDYPICAKPGYRIIAEEIFRRADGGGRCRTCSPKTQALVNYALQLMQQRHPRELREGLSYLG
ncbi:hypothetical protein Anas_12204 [Armadillidium nasatum]|uniref:Uncharacterized protein n=1 Tax=Armadillidium nasatum TaxID=96803 RepID=A0A5N5TGK2_9CRUS|nr:hypothetical protein Anas_12204 [Armadillidium nasatum]